jgi:hypothetical protein
MGRLGCMIVVIDVITRDAGCWRSCMRKNNGVLHIDTIISTRNNVAKVKERLICVRWGIFRGIKSRKRKGLFIKDDIL